MLNIIVAIWIVFFVIPFLFWCAVIVGLLLINYIADLEIASKARITVAAKEEQERTTLIEQH